MSEPGQAGREERTLSILDVMLALAQSWKLIIGVPLLVGIAGVVVALVMPDIYQSRALVRLASVGAIIEAPNVLVPVIDRLNLRRTDESVDGAIEKLQNNIWFGAYEGSDAMEIRVSDESPIRARAILTEIIKELFRESVPRGRNRTLLELRLADLQAAIAELQGFSDKLAEPPTLPSSAAESEGHTRSLAIIVSDLLAKQSESRSLEVMLEGLGDDSILLPPTTPDRPVRGSKLIGIVLAVAAALFLAVLFVLTRSVIRFLMRDPGTSTRMAEIRQALRWRRPKVEPVVPPAKPKPAAATKPKQAADA